MQYNTEVDVSAYNDGACPIKVKEDGTIVINELEMGLIDSLFCDAIKKTEIENEKYKAEGWSGTGLVGHYILYLKTALARFRAISAERW